MIWWILPNNRELWLLEDMSFAVVHNVSMVVKSEDYYYTTEYRSIVKLLKERDDLFFTPESLMEELDDMLSLIHIFFIAMPSRKAADGEYRDIAHPINSGTRDMIQRVILSK